MAGAKSPDLHIYTHAHTLDLVEVSVGKHSNNIYNVQKFNNVRETIHNLLVNFVKKIS